MKKLLIFGGVIVVLFVAIIALTNMSNSSKLADNPYGTDDLDQATIDLLGDENYQNIILPDALEAQIQESEMRSEELSALLADGATYQDEEKSKLLVSEYKALEESIPLLYEKWEELQMLLE